VSLTNGNNEIVMALKSGRAIRFNEQHVRPMGRTASGVRGVSLSSADDEVVGMVCINNLESQLLVVSEKGYGKRSSIDEYRVTNRGGKGVKTISVTEKTGNLVAILEVQDSDDLMIINRSGITIRLQVSALRIMGRATQGVRLIKLNETDEISSVAKIENIESEEKEETDLTDIIPSDQELDIVEGEAGSEDEADETEESDSVE
jgi:DNA gyrase subunit A